VAVAVILLLLASGAAGARQPAPRASVPLPASASTIAAALGLSTDDRSLLLLDVIRRLYDVPEGGSDQEAALRGKLADLFRAAPAGESVPLPLAPDVWRRTLAERPASDGELVGEILSTRSSALLYHGLAALDDETLAWLGEDRDTLLHLRIHPGAFAVFGRSVRVRAGRMVVPGGSEAEPIWRQIVDADPARPAAFIRRLFRDDKGRLAFFYDTIAHLDPPRMRFALGGPTMAPQRVGALADVFRGFAREWDIEARPFTRPQIDPSITLSTIAVTADGRPIGPVGQSLWDRVFRDDNEDIAFADGAASRAEGRPDRPIDAAWLASRIHFEPYNVSRRRLDTLLFAQRVLDGARSDPREIATILRALTAMPALIRTVERMGVRDVRLLLAAARHARALNGIGDQERRRTAVMQFQATVALVDRAVWSRGLSGGQAAELLASLVAVPVSGRGYDGRLASWIPATLLALAPEAEASDPLEERMLALIAGAGSDVPRPVVEWEGRRYRVDFAAADLSRLRRIRERQEAASLDAAIRRAIATRSGGREAERAERTLAETLTSILYAAHLGSPDSPALSGGDVALRHDLDVSSTLTRVRAAAAWRVPVEVFGQRAGWRVSGSLLGLDLALRRLALRRLDPSMLPPGPRLPLLDRQTLMLTVAFFNPHALTDEGRDAIAAAMARGRARAAGLARDREALDTVARDAGLSEWRREALRWTVAQSPEHAAAHFSPLELFWLGLPDANADAWGAALTPLTGCFCLGMPRRGAWEDLAGRRASGVLGTRGVDVALQVTDALAALELPASLAAGVLGFAVQDVADDAQAGYFSDWAAFGRAAQRLSRDRIVDYIAALTADGPLVPVVSSSSR
jgi:hypothetical protein